MARIAILVSGEGRLMRQTLDLAFFHEIEGLEVAGVISSSGSAPALTCARSFSVPSYVIEDQLFPNSTSFGMALLNMLKDIDTDYVIIDDFLPDLGPAARGYYGKIVGIFPALVPAFENLSACQVIPETIARGVTVTGATAYMADENGRIGRIIAQSPLDVLPGDTAQTLAARMFAEIEVPLIKKILLACCGQRNAAEEH